MHGAMKDNTLNIQNGMVSDDKLRLKVKQKDTVRWIGDDSAYDLWFKEEDWHFHQKPDRTEDAYCIIEVRQGKHTQPYWLECDIPANSSHDHDYGVRKTTASASGAPPTGPTIIGEG